MPIPASRFRIWLALVPAFLLIWATPGLAQVQWHKVLIDSTPQGATITLEKTKETLGVTPFSSLLPRGHRVVIVEKAGFAPVRVVLGVDEDLAPRHISLVALEKPGTIRLTFAPLVAGAEVVIGDHVLGTVPAGATEWTGTAPRGQYLIRIRQNGRDIWTDNVVVIPGSVSHFQAVVQKKGVAKGEIIVISTPPNAAIWVNGIEVGRAPQALSDLAPGTYLVSLRSQDHLTAIQEVVVRADERVTVEMQMAPLPANYGILKVLSDVPGTSVTVDGEDWGLAPAIGAIPPGTPRVTVVAPGFLPIIRRPTIKAGATAVVAFNHEELTALPYGGTIRVFGGNICGEIFLSGKSIGPIPQTVAHLEPRTYRLEIRCPGFQAINDMVKIEAGKILHYHAELKPLNRLRVEVKDGTVWRIKVDGVDKGTTPWEGAVAPGKHDIILESLVRVGETVEKTASVAAGKRVVTAIDTPAAPLDTRVLPGSALTTAPGSGYAQVSLGWPYPLSIALGTGLTEGIEFKSGIRSLLLTVVFEGFAELKFNLYASRNLALAVELSTGGGAGFNLRGSAWGRATFLSSFMLSRYFAATVRIGAELGGEWFGNEVDDPWNPHVYGSVRLGANFDFALPGRWRMQLGIEGELPIGPDRKFFDTGRIFGDGPGDPFMPLHGWVAFSMLF